MGGVEKGLIDFCGRPLITHVIDIVRPQTAHVLISANRCLDAYAALGARSVPDRWPNFQGPLAGIASTLAEVTTPYLLIVPCDTPFLPRDMVARLSTGLVENDVNAAVAHDATRMQPLCALMRSDLATDLNAYVEAGGAKAARWWVEQRAVQVEFSDPSAFVNINTPEEKNIAEKAASHTRQLRVPL